MHGTISKPEPTVDTWELRCADCGWMRTRSSIDDIYLDARKHVIEEQHTVATTAKRLPQRDKGCEQDMEVTLIFSPARGN